MTVILLKRNTGIQLSSSLVFRLWLCRKYVRLLCFGRTDYLQGYNSVYPLLHTIPVIIVIRYHLTAGYIHYIPGTNPLSTVYNFAAVL